MRGLRLALSLLTVAPVRAPDAPSRRDARAAMLWAPLVGLLVGAAAAGAVFVTRAPSRYDLAAVLGVATLALLTRGLHLDGLADTADGLGSLRSPAEAAEVMRRGDVGPFGVVAVVLVLLAQVTALAACLAGRGGTSAILLAAVVGRLAATLSCTPRTRPLGAGLGALVVGAVPRAAAFAVTAAVLAFAWVAGAVDEESGLPGGLYAVAAVVVALAAAHALRWHCTRRLGGVNGDVLGAQVETAVTVVLVMLALETWP